MKSVDKIETTLVSAASKSMGGGALTSVFGWVMSNEGIAIMGLAVTLLGFGINLYFQRRRDRREQELHVVRLASFHTKITPPSGEIQ